MPTASYCDEIRRQYGLDDIPVLYDDGSFRDLGIPANHTHLVMSRGMRVEHRVRYRDDTFRPAIEAVLDR